MGKEIVLFSSEQRLSLSDAVAFLRELADKLETQQVTLQQGADAVTLALPEMITLELKAEEEDKKGRTKRSLEVELEWMEGESTPSGVVLS